MSATEALDEVLATSPDELREQALRQLKKRRDFHTHAFVYVLVNTVVLSIWAIIGATSGSWSAWPLFLPLAWGIGLASNAWDVYLRRPFTEDEIRREEERLRAHV